MFIFMFFFKNMRTLIENGYVFIATPPLYLCKKGKEGVCFLDEDGSELFGGGRDLAHVHSVDLTLFRLYVGTARFRVMCDEKIPLLGPNGAVSSCTSLDGADPQSTQPLERGMESYANVLEGEFGGVGLAGVRDVPGAGAAGGLGAACAAFLSARLSDCNRLQVISASLLGADGLFRPVRQ